ncbi:MAG TPA: YtxH domain-containing protein [Chitinophagaceae bacterium]|jgi:gas vesicle protein|nr:YtxH domain-containing protein [Chitinophagaceae bacterium]
MTTNSKIILGLVGATAAGVLVGLLLAPDKGTEMRKKITETAGDWASQLTDIFNDAKEQVTNLANQGSKAAGDAASRYTNSKENFS